MKIETLAVHAGVQPDPATGAVAPPIVLSSTYERAADGSYPSGHVYSRTGNPNRLALERAIAALESDGSGMSSSVGEVAQAAAFASGSAATTAVIQSLAPGDHVIFPRECYLGTAKTVREIGVPWGIEAEFCEVCDPQALRAAIRPRHTRLVWVETPSNPRLRITDIADAAAACHEAGAILVVDNTWPSPVLTQPLKHGADLVVHATSKSIGGHSDLIGGVVIAGTTEAARRIFARIRTIQHVGGAVPSPFDCWLALRGLRTLPLRIRAQSASALTVARWLASHQAVERVYYPGLRGDAGYHVAERQMQGGFGTMLSFRVAGGREAAIRAAARVRLFTRATSLGGLESLIEHRASVENYMTTTPDDLLRLSIGLEAPEDLVADLAQALDPEIPAQGTPPRSDQL